jgi:CRP-like cAMP-binding protein
MNLIDELATIDAFRPLRPDQLGVLAAHARRVRLGGGEVLFRTGEPATELGVVRSGRLAVIVDAPGRHRVVLDTVEPDGLVGWSWLRQPATWHFDVIASVPSEVILFEAEPLRHRMRADHELGYVLLEHIVQVAVDRLLATRLRLLDLYATEALR